MSGFYTVFMKELEDNFSRWRFIILFALVLLVGISSIYIAATNIRGAVGIGNTDRFIFLALFTTPISNATNSMIPNSFLQLIALLIPVTGIALGLDAINSEKNNGTMSRLISQPIYRDTVISAKFFAGMVTIAILMVTVVLLVSGLGLRMVGVPPSSEEAWRLLLFVVMSIVYGSFWLGLSILFSTLFKRVATSALASVAVWIFFAFIFNMIYQFIASSMKADTIDVFYQNVQRMMTIVRLSPIQLFNESMAFMLIPGAITTAQTLQIIIGNAQDYFQGGVLSVGQSLLTVWPQLVIMILLTVVCFAISYVKFMREEIRAT